MTVTPPPPIPDDIAPLNGRFVGSLHYFACRVYFEDTDFSGIVYHANYLRYMERARSDMLRLLDMDQGAAFDAGDGVYAVADMTLKYLKPAKLNDDLVIISRVTKLRAASVIMAQDIWRKSASEEDHILSASVQAAFLTPVGHKNAGRPRRQPKAWTKAFRNVMETPDENIS